MANDSTILDNYLESEHSKTNPHLDEILKGIKNSSDAIQKVFKKLGIRYKNEVRAVLRNGKLIFYTGNYKCLIRECSLRIHSRKVSDEYAFSAVSKRLGIEVYDSYITMCDQIRPGRRA